MKRVTDITALEGAIVINNCGELRLADGTLAIWGEIINPEDKGVREYMENEAPWRAISLPISY
jgi:hypothetical protein